MPVRIVASSQELKSNELVPVMPPDVRGEGHYPAYDLKMALLNKEKKRRPIKKPMPRRPIKKTMPVRPIKKPMPVRPLPKPVRRLVNRVVRGKGLNAFIKKKALPAIMQGLNLPKLKASALKAIKLSHAPMKITKAHIEKISQSIFPHIVHHKAKHTEMKADGLRLAGENLMKAIAGHKDQLQDKLTSAIWKFLLKQQKSHKGQGLVLSGSGMVLAGSSFRGFIAGIKRVFKAVSQRKVGKILKTGAKVATTRAPLLL